MPNLGSRLALKLAGPRPQPAQYGLGTVEFRYWTGADALRRGADFWTPLLPANTRWFTGAVLDVTLDAGRDLNAFYDRAGLSFFHDTVSGQAVFSGESPDVVCHELGHAVLDAIRPQLWNASSDEVAAFHESFGDMSAILAALQLPTLRAAVLADTGGRLNRSSRLSRMAEQLGWAIRQIRPDDVDPDCLRNAVNSFFYQDPQSLPPDAPASRLSTEPHSFSRVFTGGFFEALAGMFNAQGGTPGEQELLQTSLDMGRLLVDGVLAAPVVSDYYSQVAAHMIEADELRFARKYRDALKSAFVRRGILSLSAAAALTGAAPPAARGMAGEVRRGRRDATAGGHDAPRLQLSGAAYGLGNQGLRVVAVGEGRRFHVASAALDLGSSEPPAGDKAARSFVEDLFRRGRIDIGPLGDKDTRLVHPHIRKTHLLVERDGAIELKRRTFDCGFD